MESLDKSGRSQGSQIFSLLNEIDQKISSCRNKAILFVGLTKAGKSTTFNWLSNIPLKGVKEGEKGRKICYQPAVTKGTQAPAIVSGGFTSCTLVPNILDYKDYHIVDTAGYEDKRNYIGTIGVSYSLKAIFEVVEQVKFVIVLSQTALYSNISFLFSTFQNFLSMFKIDQISEETKSRIFSSTSLLITKCQKPDDIKSDIENCLQELRNPDLDIKNKELISSLLQHLLLSDKIAIFRMASINQSPQQPKVIEKLNEKQWKFLNLSQEKINGNSATIIELPFNQLFEKLVEGQKVKLKDSIKDRITSYQRFCDIVHDIVSIIISIEHINNTNLQQNQFHRRISQFISENDHYQSEKYVDCKTIETYQIEPKKLNALKLIIELNKVIVDVNFAEFQEFEAITVPFMKKMAIYRVRFTKLSDLLMKMYSNNKSNAFQLLKLKYILLRGIRQFEMLFNICEERVNDASQRINDGFENIFQGNSIQIIQTYIKSFQFDCLQITSFNINEFNEASLSKMEKYFENQREALEFQSYFRAYHKEKVTPIIEYYPLMRQVKLILAKYSYLGGDYHLAGRHLLQSFEYQCQYERCIERCRAQENAIADEANQDFIKKMKNHYLTRVIILNSLKQTLIKTRKYEIAIQIAESNRDVLSVCNIYQLLLKSSGLSLQKRKELLQKYSAYCFNHGRWRESCELLEELFNCETSSFERKMEINKSLVEYVKSESKSREQYQKYLQGFCALSVGDETVQILIKKIKESLII